MVSLVSITVVSIERVIVSLVSITLVSIERVIVSLVSIDLYNALESYSVSIT